MVTEIGTSIKSTLDDYSNSKLELSTQHPVQDDLNTKIQTVEC
jgi:hypothetical protein